jgi:alcohol dehydrogenase
MKAVVYEAFSTPPTIQHVRDPSPEPHGAVIEIKATGVCRSDWHGWVGHDADIRLPHVPGHELAGTIVALGKDISRWKIGDQVTMPFVAGCGACPQCSSGNHQVCDHQFQPGFTHWGSFAQYTSVHHADINLVRLPETLGFAAAASLGCRFATSFRAVVDQGKLSAGQWLAVHGCGGVGLSAIMIGNAIGANIIAIDIAEEKLSFAKSIGAAATINANKVNNVVEAIKEITKGGAHVSIDALGHPTTCFNSISSLRKRGKHIQVGLMLAENSTPQIPMSKVIANELEILGSHGMQAYRYEEMLAMIKSGKLVPEKLIGKTISLEESIEALMKMDQFEGTGVTVITRF